MNPAKPRSLSNIAVAGGSVAIVAALASSIGLILSPASLSLDRHGRSHVQPGMNPRDSRHSLRSGSENGLADPSSEVVSAVFRSPEHAAISGRLSGADEGATFSRHAAVGSEAGSSEFSFERALGSDSGMTREDVDALIEDRDLPRLIDRFALESGKNSDAAMLLRIFRPAIENALAEVGGGMRLAGLACGAQVCVGTISEGSVFEYLAWRDEFALAPEIGGAQVSASTISEPDGSAVMRFLFFIDPSREPIADISR